MQELLPERRGFRGLSYDEDPLAALPNLFDAAIVFAVALMVALATAHRVPLRGPSSESHAPKVEGTERVPLTSGRGVAAGGGTRVGIAYRLESGELVYVPDTSEAKEAPPSVPPSPRPAR